MLTSGVAESYFQFCKWEKVEPEKVEPKESCKEQ